MQEVQTLAKEVSQLKEVTWFLGGGALLFGMRLIFDFVKWIIKATKKDEAKEATNEVDEWISQIADQLGEIQKQGQETAKATAEIKIQVDRVITDIKEDRAARLISEEKLWERFRLKEEKCAERIQVCSDHFKELEIADALNTPKKSVKKAARK